MVRFICSASSKFGRGSHRAMARKPAFGRDAMTKTSVNFFVVTVVVALSSCAGTTKPTEGQSTTARTDAVVREQGSTAGAVFSFLTTPITGSRFSTTVTSIDGKNVSKKGQGREWSLTPGKHTLGIRCKHEYGSSINLASTETIEAELVGGHIYQLQSKLGLRAEAGGRKCNTTIQDVTGNGSSTSTPN